ncbi:hypothetical protein THAOC_02089 [Thalassiosira oceanica]|uniref:Uncharacterized protein n=1 Tax=Thalassiosira oceanica TaxID=159749 RepID=K0TQJ7_THAOC|nr:hypothetical protein THAOC_02089 [Thalassiosira oceanica]|eukprot:EJK76167.1 hypothetical protein THAOC_02089 [Thalassiosira oceanica]
MTKNGRISRHGLFLILWNVGGFGRKDHQSHCRKNQLAHVGILSSVRRAGDPLECPGARPDLWHWSGWSLAGVSTGSTRSGETVCLLARTQGLAFLLSQFIRLPALFCLLRSPRLRCAARLARAACSFLLKHDQDYPPRGTRSCPSKTAAARKGPDAE